MLRNVVLIGSMCLIAARSPAVPVIHESPADAVGFIGGSAGFHVEATGNGTLTYEWSINGTPINGSDDESLNLTNLTLSSVGAYKVRIEDDDGAVESRSAYLCVTPEDGGDVEYRFSPRLPVPDGMTFNAVAHDGSRFVAVGKDGVIITSADGKVWRTGDSATSCNLNGIAVGEGRLVVVGDEGYVLSSDDGEHWWQRRRKGGSILRAVVHANDRFVAVGACGEVIFSDDQGIYI